MENVTSFSNGIRKWRSYVYHKVKQILIRELLKRMDYLGIKMDDEIPREYYRNMRLVVC